MRRFSSDKDINGKVRSLLKSGWRYRPGKRHPSLISPRGGRLVIPSTPSDRRAFYNFCRDVRRVLDKGLSHAE